MTMPKSKQLSDTLKEVLSEGIAEHHRLPNMSRTRMSQKAAVINSLTGMDVVVDPHPPGPMNVSVKNFVFDPYGTRCTWVQDYKGKECSVQLFSLEYQPPNAVADSLRNYHPGQGLHLIVTYGCPSIGVPGSFKKTGGSKLMTTNSERYVHKDTYRGMDIVFYKILTDLVSAARLKGLAGLRFPENWDQIPYD